MLKELIAITNRVFANPYHRFKLIYILHPFWVRGDTQLWRGIVVLDCSLIRNRFLEEEF